MSKLKCRVLIVEDVKVAQKVACLGLAQLGCETDVADTGIQALELAQKYPYDLIFMDLGLPDMDGITVTETLRKMEGSVSHIPIIALTAYDDVHIRESCLLAGINDFLVKPLTMADSQHILKKYIKSS